MNIFKKTKFLIFISLFLLTGCNETLYGGLSEKEGNEMLAILLLNHIQASKEEDKNGKIVISVDKDDFVNAVEDLRQRGYPKRNKVDINTMFPPGQLVTSPDQEKAKLTFLKEQQLEQMFLSMDGVIDSKVNIASEKKDDIGNLLSKPTISIFIKYSPAVNLMEYKQKIINLVFKSVSGVNADDISVFLMPANYQYQSKEQNNEHNDNSQFEWSMIISLIILTIGLILFILVFIKTKKKEVKP